jgi:hypothetical protein
MWTIHSALSVLPSSFWLDCCVLKSVLLMRRRRVCLNGQGLRELQHAVLAKIFRRKEEEATGDWRKFHNEFHDLYSSSNGWVFYYFFILTCICLSRGLFCMTLGTVPHHTWRHTGAIVRYLYVYHVSRDAFRSFSKRYPSYALRKHICGSGLWKG